MKIIVFFLYVPFVYSELHTFITTYTGVRGATTARTSTFSAVTSLDGHQIGVYDSKEKKLVPKQTWMEGMASHTHWMEHTVIKDEVQHIYRNNILSLMQHFPQSGGVQAFQGMFGCWWDDQAGDSDGFDQYGFDGQDLITLDVTKSRYVASVPKANITVHEWNKNREGLEVLNEYYEYGCVYWLRKFSSLTKTAFGRTEHPKMSLLQQKMSFAVDCHVTGFYSNNTVILWKKNGKVIKNYALVKFGDTLPNEDGTFQKTVTLNVSPDEWKKDQYTCVMEHMGNTIIKILNGDEIKTNRPTKSYLTTLACTVVAVIFIVLLFIYAVVRRKLPKLNGYELLWQNESNKEI